MLKCTTEKLKRAVKSKPRDLRHLKVDPVLKIEETFYKQAKSMCVGPSYFYRTKGPRGDQFNPATYFSYFHIFPFSTL